MKQNKRTAGFTLVELIVVIAILGILAGVGTVGYSGYIKMARESADNQLLSAVNTAFASACLENNIQTVNVADAAIKIEDQKIQGLSSVENTTGDLSNSAKVNIAASFLRYIAGNETTEFKTEGIKSLQWDVDRFVIDKENAAVSMVVFQNGNVATLDQAAINAIMGSVFADMGSEEVIAMLNSNINSAKSIFGLSSLTSTTKNKIISSLQSGGFKDVFSDEQKAEIISQLRASSPMPWDSNFTTYWENQVKVNDMLANGALLYTAKALEKQNATAAGYAAKLQASDDPLTTVNSLSNATGGMGQTILDKALATAMSEAYLNSEAGQAAYSAYKAANPQKDEDDFKETFTSTSGENDYNKLYKEYLTSDAAQTDLDGFLGSMTIVNDNVDTLGRDELVSEGTSNADLKNLLVSILGS